MTEYSKGSHTVFHPRYHRVWITKYRYRVLQGDWRWRVRTSIAPVAEEMGVRMVHGVLSSDHVPIFAEIPPHVAVSDLVKIAKGRRSRKIQQEFPEISKRYWGRHFWGRGFFSTTSGNVTDERINAYLNGPVDAHQSDHENNITLE